MGDRRQGDRRGCHNHKANQGRRRGQRRGRRYPKDPFDKEYAHTFHTEVTRYNAPSEDRRRQLCRREADEIVHDQDEIITTQRHEIQRLAEDKQGYMRRINELKRQVKDLSRQCGNFGELRAKILDLRDVACRDDNKD